MHAVGSQSFSHVGSRIQNRLFPKPLSRVASSGSNILALMVSDSIIYYSMSVFHFPEHLSGISIFSNTDCLIPHSTLSMYTATFIVGQSYIRLAEDACRSPWQYYSTSMQWQPSPSALVCAEEGATGIMIDSAVGLVTMMTMLTGILAPKLLLNIRREFYIDPGSGEGGSSHHAQRTVSWLVNNPVGRESDSVSHVRTILLMEHDLIIICIGIPLVGSNY